MKFPASGERQDADCQMIDPVQVESVFSLRELRPVDNNNDHDDDKGERASAPTPAELGPEQLDGSRSLAIAQEF